MTHTETHTHSGSADTMDQARDSAADLAGRARSTARASAEKASGEAARMARNAQSGAADEVGDVASALRTAADELRSGSPQERTFSQIAEGLADVSDAIRDKDMGEIVAELSDFGRRNPLMFIGGAALVGFAAMRFAKASSERTAPRSAAAQRAPAPQPDGGAPMQAHATPSADPSSAAFRATDTPRPMSQGSTASKGGV